MINLAENPGCDPQIERELKEAGIDLVFHERRLKNEVPASITGELFGGKYRFTRGWYYWIVSGKVPLDLAKRMYAHEERRDVRVDGHCMSPPPEDWAEPSEKELRFYAEGNEQKYQLIKDCRYVTCYHIDSQEGLNFFVKFLKGEE